MIWAIQGILLAILVLWLLLRDAVAPRPSRLCRNLAIGILAGAVLACAGAFGLFQYSRYQGFVAPRWLITFLQSDGFDSVLVPIFNYAPFVGALVGAISAWWVTRLRRPRNPEDS